MDGRVLSRKYRDSIPSEKKYYCSTEFSMCINKCVYARFKGSVTYIHKYTYIHTYLNDVEMRIIVIASQERLSEVAVAEISRPKAGGDHLESARQTGRPTIPPPPPPPMISSHHSYIHYYYYYNPYQPQHYYPPCYYHKKKKNLVQDVEDLFPVLKAPTLFDPRS